MTDPRFPFATPAFGTPQRPAVQPVPPHAAAGVGPFTPGDLSGPVIAAIASGLSMSGWGMSGGGMSGGGIGGPGMGGGLGVPHMPPLPHPSPHPSSVGRFGAATTQRGFSGQDWPGTPEGEHAPATAFLHDACAAVIRRLFAYFEANEERHSEIRPCYPLLHQAIQAFRVRDYGQALSLAYEAYRMVEALRSRTPALPPLSPEATSNDPPEGMPGASPGTMSNDPGGRWSDHPGQA